MNTEFLGIEVIQMVDLKNQYLRIKPSIDAAIQECIDNAAFIKGPQVGQFEKQLADYLEVKHVITCANGTDALQLALMALDLKPGDEVIVPAFTYVATAEVIALLGLIPVIVDVDPGTFTMTARHIEEALSDNTKAVVPVHLFGQCADMEEILQLCHSKGIFLVEDNAQAIGSHYTFKSGKTSSSGSVGDLGTTSFFPSKNLGCFGDGGAVYTNDDHLAAKVRMIANHGQAEKYKHEVVGVNSRLDTLQAAILIEKLQHLDRYIADRQIVADCYDQLFTKMPEIQTPQRARYSTHVFHQYTIKVPSHQRDALKAHLQQKQIPSMVYYPIPLSEQRAYEGLGRVAGALPVTKDLCKTVLSLPMHTELTKEQVEYIGSSVIEFLS